MVDRRHLRFADVQVNLREGPSSGFVEHRLSKDVGVTQFGVNLVRLAPGAKTALRHWHEAEDEFVYVLAGNPSLIDDMGEQRLEPGDCIGFPAGEPNAHHIVNNSIADASCIVVGSRRPGEETIHYPDDDLGPIHK